VDGHARHVGERDRVVTLETVLREVALVHVDMAAGTALTRELRLIKPTGQVTTGAGGPGVTSG
jgi:hypothetical protein